ncbi:MAG: chorismate mutase [Phycisphaerae bacterium]
MSEPLNELRTRIDALDKQLVAMLNERARVVEEVGRLKRGTGIPIYAPDREQQVLAKLRSLNEGPLPDRCLEAIWRELMSGSFFLEKPLRIAYPGPTGSFAHAAAVRKFGKSVEYEPVVGVAAAFEEVTRQHADYALVPADAAETFDAFGYHPAATLYAEVPIVMHQHLLGKEAWETVGRIYGTPEVLGLCRRWLNATARGREVVSVGEPLEASRRAAEEAGSACIGTEVLAELNNLAPLFERIEDNPDRIGRFFTLSLAGPKKSGDDKTALLLTTHDHPGALAEVLDVFRMADVNLTDITKQPARQTPGEQAFFVEIQGHAADTDLARTVDVVRKLCLRLTVLGSYPRAAEVL